MSKNKPMPVEPSGGEALVASGQALTKMQDETMMTIAVQRKREIVEVRESVISEVNSFPEFADRYYYSIPHKTKRCEHGSGVACPTCEYVEGPSIHAALALQRYWGNCASSWQPLEETDEHFWCMGTFVDYERNVKVQRPFRADKMMKPRSGKPYMLSGDRLAKAINAAGSKAHRNAILAGIPDPLKLLVFKTAKDLTVGAEPDKRLSQKQIDAVLQEFAKWEVDEETIVRKLGKPSQEWTMKDRARLLGLRNALLDGEASERVFGSVVKKTQGKPAPEPEPEPEERTFSDEDSAIVDGVDDPKQPTDDPFLARDFDE